jgi:hypothetical protein
VSGGQRRRCRSAVAAAALVVAGVSACGSEGADGRGLESEIGAGDPGYAYRVIARLRESPVDAMEPRSLAEAAKGRVSDLVVTGRITRVAPGEGIYYPHADPLYLGDEEAGAMVVAFEDPEAAERSARVTMQVDWSAGAEVGNTLHFRIGVPMDVDADRFLAGVRGIDHAVVLLDQDDAGRDRGEYRPILGGAGLGSVDDHGNVSFRGLGDDERAFLAGIGTLDDLEAEASRPETSVEH